MTDNENADSNGNTSIQNYEGSPINPNNVVVQETTNKTYCFIKTSFMVFIWICMGAYIGMNNTSIDDLRMLIGCDYEHITRVFMVSSVGMLVGSVISGPISDMLPIKVDLIMFLSTLLMTAPFIAIPWCLDVSLMATMFALQGLGRAAISASGNAHVMAIWGKDNTTPVLFLHFGYALGSIIGPLIVVPFLIENNINSTTNSTLKYNENSLQMFTYDNYILYRPEVFTYRNFYSENDKDINLLDNNSNNTTITSKLWISYTAAGGFGVLIAFILLIYFIYGLPSSIKARLYKSGSSEAGRDTNRLRHVLSPASCADGDKIFVLQFIPTLFLFYIFTVGKDVAFLTFLLPIAINPSGNLHMTKKSADFLNTVCAICATAGRLLFAGAAKCIPIQILVFVQISAILAAQIVLLIWGLDSVLIYWIASCVYCLFNSPNFPSVLAWADRYITVTAVVVAIIDIATGVSIFIFTYSAGYVFQYKGKGGAIWVMYLSLGAGVAMFAFMVLLQVLGSCHGNRHDFQTHLDIENEEDTQPILNNAVNS